MQDSKTIIRDLGEKGGREKFTLSLKGGDRDNRNPTSC